MRKKSVKRRVRFLVDDRVQYSFLGKVGDTGTVVSVVNLPRVGLGGVRAKLKVKWDTSGFVGSVEDRKLVKLPKGKS